MRLIALIGPKRSGKTEVAKILKSKGFACVKFAQPLKDMILSLPGITQEHIEEDLKDLPCDVFNGKTVRHAMQTLGTEWGRNCIDSDLWLSLWKAKIKNRQLVVVDDCRFKNEAQAVRDLDGDIWESRREGVDYAGHSSETEMAEIVPDVTIQNTGSIGDLANQIMSQFGQFTFEKSQVKRKKYATENWSGNNLEPPPRQTSRVMEGTDV